MSDRATCWSVTINNPISADDENIALAKQRSGWKIEGQLEQGENGTKHYQMMVKTPQIRFSQIKKAFPRAHIEIARNVKALSEYVQKEDTRVGAIPNSDKYPTLSQLWVLYSDWHCQGYGPYCTTDEDERLAIFDQFISDHIELGYHVETMGVNPQIRSSVKKYINAILIRSQNIRRQKTDRQTEINSDVNDITDEGSVQETVCTQSEESTSEESDQDTESGSEGTSS